MPPNDLPDALVPHFGMGLPNAAIKLRDATLLITKGTRKIRAEGAIVLHWAPRKRLSFHLTEPLDLEAADDGRDLEIELDGLHLSGPGFLTSWGTSHCEGIFSGTIAGSVVMADDPSLYSALFHVPNLRRVHGAWVRQGSLRTASRQTASNGDWQVVLDPVPAQSGVIAELEAVGGYAFTHTGEVRKVDGKPFRGKHLQALLERLAALFSFVRGAWTGPFLCIGRDMNDQPAWESWTQWNCSAWRNPEHWVPQSFDLNDLLTGFLAATDTAEQKQLISEAIFWYVEAADQAGGLEGSLILLQATLEYLAWYRLVKVDELLDDESFRNMTAYGKIRTLLRASGVSVEFQGLRVGKSDLGEHAHTVKDIPRLITALRNHATHPSDKQAGRPSTTAYQAAWKYALWATELSLLRLFGYSGAFHSRVDNSDTVYTEQAVPWADPVPA